MFRAALLRIEANAEHLERWRRAEFAAGTPEWILGEGLDHLARTGDVPRYAPTKPSPSSNGGRRQVLRRYRGPFGGRSAEVTMLRLFLSRREAIGLGVLLMAEYGWNLSVIDHAQVPRALPDPGEDGYPTYRIPLEKARRGRGHQFETRNLTDDGAASNGQLITQALQATRFARAVVEQLAPGTDLLVVWRAIVPGATRKRSHDRPAPVGPFAFGVDTVPAYEWATSLGVATGSPFRRGRRTVNALDRREPGQNSQDTHDRDYVLPDKRVRDQAVEVIAAGAEDAERRARAAVLVAEVRDEPVAGDVATATADCADYDNSPAPGLDGGCGLSFLDCLGCTNARVHPGHHGTLALLHQSLGNLRSVLPVRDFDRDWNDHYARLDDLKTKVGDGSWRQALVTTTAADREPIDFLLTGDLRAQCDRQTVFRLATADPFVISNPAVQAKRVRGLRHLLDWLADQVGDTWQQRWANSGAETLGARWRQAPLAWLEAQGRRSVWLPSELSSALLVLIFADVVRPALRWLVCVPSIKSELAEGLALDRDPSGFARLREHCRTRSGITQQVTRLAAQRAAVILAAKGGILADITVGDVLELVDTETEMLAAWPRGIPAFYQILHDLGFLGEQAPLRFRQLRTGGQLTPEQLVDRYGLQCRPIRDLLVAYLRERQPSLDYNSLKDLAYYLARRFWKDLEVHHPGIDSLRLAPEVAAGWRERLLTKRPPGSGSDASEPIPRISYRECLVKVRAFYLDLSQWALEDPARWAPWVAPCPVGRDDVEHRKAKRRHKARMDARTRERLPVLPVLVATVEQRRLAAAELLAAAQSTEPGQSFTLAGQQLTRLRPWTGKLLVADTAGHRRDLRREEEYAFWAWAAVNTLRLTGVRIEELMEITHHSLIQYRLPTTGELVPLLQIAPSKTDVERLLVVSPELADVLSAIIVRVRDDTGTVPLVPAYDWHECVWRPPAPVLFQRRFGVENRAISHGTIRKMIQAALADTGLTDPVDGGPLNYTPHDFRRLFITDAPSSMACHRISPKSSPGTATSTSRWAIRRSIPRNRSKRTWHSWPGAAACAPARSIEPPPRRNGPSSSATSSGARSPPASAPAPTQHPASTNTPVCAAPCTGRTRHSDRASSISATTSSTGSPKRSAKDGSAKSKDSASAWPAPTTSSPRSTDATRPPSWTFQPPPSIASADPKPRHSMIDDKFRESGSAFCSPRRTDHVPSPPHSCQSRRLDRPLGESERYSQGSGQPR